MVEYIAVVAMIALVAVVSFRVFGKAVFDRTEYEALCIKNLQDDCKGGGQVASNYGSNDGTSSNAHPASDAEGLPGAGNGAGSQSGSGSSDTSGATPSEWGNGSTVGPWVSSSPSVGGGASNSSGGLNVGNPPIPNSDSVQNPSYVAFGGPLFSKGAGDAAAVAPSDINQGQLGDCYVLASLAAVSVQNPQVVQNMVQDNGNGTYTVHFHQSQPVWKFWASNTQNITVDNKFPAANGNNGAVNWACNNGKCVQVSGASYAHPGSGGEIWPMVIEKGYAIDHGGYDAIGHGGWMDGPLGAITGHQATTIVPGTKEWTFDTISNAWKNGDAITIGTLADKDAKKNPLYQGNNALVSEHAYYVTKVDPNKKTITIRNPWGWNTGETTLTWDQFKTGVSGVVTAPVDKPNNGGSNSSAKPWWQIW